MVTKGPLKWVIPPLGPAHRRRYLLAGSTAIALALTACNALSAPPSDVTQTSANLRAESVSCQASDAANPCTVWFQYWQDGSAAVQQTPALTGNLQLSNTALSYGVDDLVPGTLYHYQVCGHGDGVPPPGECLSPAYPPGLGGVGDADTVDPPGSRPSTGDLSATENFRTGGQRTTATVDLGRILSSADTDSAPISRDDGVSASYAQGQSLWVFGDTTQTNGPPFIDSGTAAAGPYSSGRTPLPMNELPTPPSPPAPGQSSPAPFFPAPSGASCPGSAAAWASGAATEPGSSTVLLPYVQVCEGSFEAQALALAEYDPASNTFVASYSPFLTAPNALPPTEALGAPVFGGDGYLYLFATVDGGVDVARVLAGDHGAWGQPSSYQWWSQPPGQGAGWYDDPNPADDLSILPPGSQRVFGPVSVGDYSEATSKRFAMLAQTGFASGGFQVLEATSPAGPWSLGPAGQPPDSCSGGTFGCYAVNGHPELSNSRQLVFSWYSPDDRDGSGHLRLGAISW